jgi:hypothetical protein
MMHDDMSGSGAHSHARAIHFSMFRVCIHILSVKIDREQRFL